MSELFHQTLSTEPLTRRALNDYFRRGQKTPNDLQIGVEWEKLGVYRDTGRAIGYTGENGVEGIFTALVKNYAWQPVVSEGHIVALRKNDSAVTLEPGGQIELSGRKAKTVRENADELNEHLREIQSVSTPRGIAWLGLGCQPVSIAEDIEWVPKKRYKIMRETLPGQLTERMMKETASIQISLDYISDQDAAEKLRLAIGLAPLLQAIYANSPFIRGCPSGLLSRRAHIWLHTSPDRSGLIREVFSPDFTLDSYIEFALDIPMIFIVRENEWIPTRMPFREFMKKGFGSYTATIADWELHLTTLFTEARLKTYVEIRSMDCQESVFGLTIPALIKGIFYDNAASKEAWSLVADISWDQRRELALRVPTMGLETPLKNGTLLDAARKLVDLADNALKQAEKGNPVDRRCDSGYLVPLKALLAQGKSPAERLLESVGDLPDDTQRIRVIIDASQI